MRSRPLTITALAALAALILLVLATGVASATDPGDAITLDVHPDDAPTDAPARGVTLANWSADSGATWTLDLDANYTVVHLRVHEGFNVTRAKQLVPLVDGRHLVELHQGNVTDVDRPALVFNITGGAPTADAPGDVAWTTRLGIPGPTTGNLTLHRDVTPPQVTVEPVGNVTDIGFDVTTRTGEPALAELVVTPMDPDGIVRTFPIVRPGNPQHFPVQGLEAASNYSFQVRLWDWSGNTVWTPPVNVTTTPEPDVPTPIVDPVTPQPNATIAPTDGLVQVSVESPGSPVLAGGVRMFVDKEEVNPRAVTVEDGFITYESPTPLPTRKVSFSVEVTNAQGGTGIARWSAHVEEPAVTAAATPLGPAVALLALAGAAVACTRGFKAR